MEELILLLDNFWILREQNQDWYYRIKDKEHMLRPFLQEELGYNLIINPQLAKIEKVPGQAEAWMGIQSLHTPLDYSFLLLALAFLEEKGSEDQFVLSELTEFIETMYPGEGDIDWTIFQQRRCLVRVLQLLRDQGLVRVTDGDHDTFSQSEETEVLYESTGLSRYFFRNFTTDITQFTTGDEILDSEWLDLKGDRGLIRRHRVYRKLVLGPVLYDQGSDDSDFLYVRNYRNTIQQHFRKMLNADFQVYKTSAMVIFNQARQSSQTFPEGNNLSDIVLQLATLIREKLEDGIWTPAVNDTLELTHTEFGQLMDECHQRFSRGWYKTYREQTRDKLIEELIAYMINWKMIALNDELRTVTLLPLAVRLRGDYPDIFVLKDGKSDE